MEEFPEARGVKCFSPEPRGFSLHLRSFGCILMAEIIQKGDES